MLTLKDIENMDRSTLTPAIVSSYLGCDQQTLRLQARQRPDLLGFPVVCVGTRVKIPKEPFLAFCRGEIDMRRTAV